MGRYICVWSRKATKGSEVFVTLLFPVTVDSMRASPAATTPALNCVCHKIKKKKKKKGVHGEKK